VCIAAAERDNIWMQPVEASELSWKAT